MNTKRLFNISVRLFFLFPIFLYASLHQATNLQLNATKDSVTLSWQDTNTQERGYKIFRNGILIAVTGNDAESFVDTGLEPNTFYRYSVKATDDTDAMLHAKKKKIVFAYYHFHQMSTETDAAINWDNITHVGWHFVRLMKDNPRQLFAYTFDDNKPIWPTTKAGEGLNDPQLAAVKTRLDMLHDKGIKVYLGVMAEHNITKEILGNKAWRKDAIDALIEAKLLGGADGLDIDIENQAVDIEKDALDEAPDKIENLYSFIKELRIALDARGLYDKAIHIAASIHFGYLTDVANSPVKRILDIVDSYFIMGYDMQWTPKAASHSLFRWSEFYGTDSDEEASGYGWSYLRAVGTLTRGIDDNMRSKLILGVPYYSYQFLTDGSALGAKKVQGFFTGDNPWGGQDISYKTIEEIIQDRNATVHVDGVHVDDDTHTPWIRWQDDENTSLWHQSYFEDANSLAIKYNFMNEQGLGGSGMWSIGEHQSNAFDTLLKEYFKDEVTSKEGSKENPISIHTLAFQDTQDTTVGSSYFNYYGGECDLTQAMYGFEYVYEINLAEQKQVDITLSIPDANTKLGIYLLDDLKESSCLAYGDTTLSKTLHAGKYYIVIDTKVVNMVDKRGVYTLEVDVSN